MIGLCCPKYQPLNEHTSLSHLESSQELAGLDKKWLAGLDTAGWLHMVRHCLHVAKKTVEVMCIERRPVFLQGQLMTPFLLWCI